MRQPTPEQIWVSEHFGRCRVQEKLQLVDLAIVEPNGHYVVLIREDSPNRDEFETLKKCMRESQIAVRERISEAQRRPGRIASGGKAAAVDYLPSNETGMVVAASVEGADGARMLVDPDATLTMVSRSVARGAGIAVAGSARTELVTLEKGRVAWVPLVRAKSIRVGDALVEDMEIGVRDIDGFDGLLGADFLRRYQFSIDRERRRITLEAW
jgi:predicted aspartyl protease